jgi:hypothetical protein
MRLVPSLTFALPRLYNTSHIGCGDGIQDGHKECERAMLTNRLRKVHHYLLDEARLKAEVESNEYMLILLRGEKVTKHGLSPAMVQSLNLYLYPDEAERWIVFNAKRHITGVEPGASQQGCINKLGRTRTPVVIRWPGLFFER